MDLSEKITILIPTYNRHAYLKRLLRYYLDNEIPLNILVADSGTVPLDDELVSIIASPRLSYLEFPSELTTQAKIRQALSKITAEYTVICADDDFIVPSAIKECIEFMEKNPDYSVALGRGCSHSLRKRKTGKIEFDWVPDHYGKSITTYGKPITFDSPSERLKFHLSHYNTTFYGVHRTNTLRFIFEEALEATSHGRLGEILLTALTLICGKMGKLPIFYASREHNSSSVERTLKILPYFHRPWSSFLASDNCDAECQRAVACLAKNLQNQTDLDMDISIKTAEEALNGYLAPLRLRLFTQNRSYLRNLLREIVKKLHLRSLTLDSYRSNRRLRAAQREYENLLGKSDSRFYENFNQVREAIIKSEVHVI
ncbi:TIGR00180 family glycosyltransferase [Chloroflexota bacterium]